MASEDYYKTLGVSRSATTEEIKKAYRKLAREYHPDRRPDDEDAATKFKKIQLAYEVLGDEEKRRKYDQYGSAFENMGSGGGYSGGAGPIDLEQIFGGGGGGFDFSDLFGGGGGGPRQRRQQRPQKGQDVKTSVTIPFYLAAEGGHYDLSLRKGGRVETLDVKIPPGIRDGATIRLSGQGEPSMTGGPAGDLLVTVKSAAHPWFKRDGANLLLDVPVSVTEAILGAKIDVPTLTEGEITVTIPAGTSSGAKLRLKGKGILDSKTKVKGDQMIVVKVVVPKNLDDEAKALVEQLAERSQQEPRSGLWGQ